MVVSTVKKTDLLRYLSPYSAAPYNLIIAIKYDKNSIRKYL